MEKVTDKLFFIEHRDTKAQSFIYENSVHEAKHRLYIVNQKWIAKNPLILYIEHRGTEARRNKYIEKVKTIEPDFYSVDSVLSKNKALCLCVSVFHSIFRKPILFYYNYFSVSLSICVQSNYPISLNAGVMNQRLYISVASW